MGTLYYNTWDNDTHSYTYTFNDMPSTFTIKIPCKNKVLAGPISYTANFKKIGLQETATSYFTNSYSLTQSKLDLTSSFPPGIEKPKQKGHGYTFTASFSNISMKMATAGFITDLPDTSNKKIWTVSSGSANLTTYYPFQVQANYKIINSYALKTSDLSDLDSDSDWYMTGIYLLPASSYKVYGGGDASTQPILDTTGAYYIYCKWGYEYNSSVQSKVPGIYWYYRSVPGGSSRDIGAETLLTTTKKIYISGSFRMVKLEYCMNFSF